MKNVNKTLNVSVGISAFNEQYTIKNVIEQVLVQNQTGWKLKEILVFTDGSTDDTVKIVSKIKNSKVRLIEGKTRKGVTFRMQQMLTEFQGDILVRFDADIELVGKDVVSNLIKPFTKDEKVMLAGGNSRPFKPQTFMEKAVYSTFEVFYSSRKTFNGGNNVFGCTGSIMALRNNFAKSLKLKNIVNEDAYIYLACVSKGFKFSYVDSAVIEYRLPKNYKDYLKQILRSEPKAVEVDLNTAFPKIAEKELRRPLIPYLKAILISFLKNPIGVSYVICLNLLVKPFIGFAQKKYNLAWFTASSTKYGSIENTKYTKTPAEVVNILGLKLVSILNRLINPVFGKFIKSSPVVICYHSVSNDSWRFSTPVDEFKRQIHFLKKYRQIVSLETLLKAKKPISNAVVITFDDGYIDNLEVAAPFLKKEKVPATFFVLGESANADRSELDNQKPLMSIKQIKELASLGFKLGFHTKTHADLSKLNDKQLFDEIVKSKKNLEMKLGTKLSYFAYPRGAHSEGILKFVKQADFSHAFTVNAGAYKNKANPLLITRLPMEKVISHKNFESAISPLGLIFMEKYMSALRFKAYALPGLVANLKGLKQVKLAKAQA